MLASGIQLKESNNHNLSQNANSPSSTDITVFYERATQTELNVPLKDLGNGLKIKEEKFESKPISPLIAVKVENDYSGDERYTPTNGVFSDDSDDISLLSLKEIKKKENNTDKTNYEELRDNKGGKKRKGKLKDLEVLTNSSPKTALSVISTKTNTFQVEKEIVEDTNNATKKVRTKFQKGEALQDVYRCCICFGKFNKRPDILHHYK